MHIDVYIYINININIIINANININININITIQQAYKRRVIAANQIPDFEHNDASRLPGNDVSFPLLQGMQLLWPKRGW